MLLLGIVVIGFFAGWVANLILGRGSFPDDWTELMIAGFAGSFVGGLLASLVSGDGIAIRPSGIIGSILGAVIVLSVWRGVRARL